MMKILMFPSGIGLSHLTRLLMIAQELRTQGVEVAFGFKKPHRLLLQAGFPIYPVADITITDFSSNVFAEYSPDRVDTYVSDELAAIESFEPDFIVGDFRFTAAISSRATGVPYISVVNAYMTHYFNPADVLMSPEKRPSQHRMARWMSKKMQQRQRRKLAEPFRRVARQYGQRDLQELYDFLSGNQTLIADLPDLYPLDNLPDTHHYIGPLVWEGLITRLPASFANLSGNNRLIYATIGNTGKLWLLQLVYEAFAGNRQYDVVMTTGAYTDPAQLPDAPNIYKARFAPGSQLIRQSEFVIHSGGSGTTYQVLAAGKPAIVIPFNNDQAINAWAIHTRHLGKGLNPTNSRTGDDLRQTVVAMLGDTDIPGNLLHYKNRLKNVKGAKNATQRILSA